MPPEQISVRGLSEFRTGLRAVDAGLPRTIRTIANKAAQLVVDAAQPRVPSGPPAGGHALSSVRTASTQTKGRVKGGGSRYPYYPWLDFGGRVGRDSSVFRPVRREGRYIFPAFVSRRDEIRDQMQLELAELGRSAGIRMRVD